MHKNISKGLLFSLSTSFLWACVIVNTRFLLIRGENPLNLVTWVFICMTVPWLVLFKRHWVGFRHISRRHLVLLVIIGIAGSIGTNYLQSLALANTSAVNFAFLYRTIVIFTIFFAWIFFKEKITKAKGILVIVILIGSYLLTTNGKGIILTRGDMYTLLMAASGAFIANILVKHTVSKMHPDLSGSVASLVTTITLLIVAIITGVFTFPKNLLLIFLGSTCSFLQIMSRNRSYKYASASFVTMVVSLTPVFVALLSYPLLHEKLDIVEIIGGLLIVSSTIFVERLQI